MRYKRYCPVPCVEFLRFSSNETLVLVTTYKVKEWIEIKFYNRNKYFKNELSQLESFRIDGIVEIGENELQVTELGQQFANLISSKFDKYSNK